MQSTATSCTYRNAHCQWGSKLNNNLNKLRQGWANGGPRAKRGPLQPFKWPAEAFRIFSNLNFPPTYHNKC